MARYDDGKRGFGVIGALGLGNARVQVRELLLDGKIKFPERPIPHKMRDTFSAIYSPDQLDAAILSQCQKEDAEQFTINVIKSGALPLWIAPTDGLLAERLIAPCALIEFGRESLVSGCYRPYNDTKSLLYGYPLFVKNSDWECYLSTLKAENAVPASQIRPSNEQVVEWSKTWIGAGKGNGMEPAWNVFKLKPDHKGL